MTEADGKTGSAPYFDPLRVELQDCFGSLKNITPDSVFSARKGLIERNKNTLETDESEETDKNEKHSKQSKSKYINIYSFNFEVLINSCHKLCNINKFFKYIISYFS